MAANREGAVSNDIASVPMVDPAFHAQGGLQQLGPEQDELRTPGTWNRPGHIVRCHEETHRRRRKSEIWSIHESSESWITTSMSTGRPRASGIRK